MLATAKRHIVSDNVEHLLKVGLGPWGKVILFILVDVRMLMRPFRLILRWQDLLALHCNA